MSPLTLEVHGGVNLKLTEAIDMGKKPLKLDLCMQARLEKAGFHVIT